METKVTLIDRDPYVDEEAYEGWDGTLVASFNLDGDHILVRLDWEGRIVRAYLDGFQEWWVAK